MGQGHPFFLALVSPLLSIGNRLHLIIATESHIDRGASLLFYGVQVVRYALFLVRTFMRKRYAPARPSLERKPE
jgi:hypothetical protein